MLSKNDNQQKFAVWYGPFLQRSTCKTLACFFISWVCHDMVLYNLHSKQAHSSMIGVSKQLSTIIEGESLLNDGMAIVLYKIFYNLAFSSMTG